MKQVFFRHLGSISYKDALSIQEQLFNVNVDIKSGKIKDKPTKNHFLLCEHHPVITLGKSGDQNNLLVNNEYLKTKGVEFYKTNRGGDITYHGPGQLVGYPILDLESLGLSVRSYSEALEETIIFTLKHYGFEAGRIKGMTGVWLDYNHPVKARKICAMGIRVSRYISMHGFAFNINTDLSFFSLIVPCGITGKAVTSLKNELGLEINMSEVVNHVKQSFEKVFGIRLDNVEEN